MHAEHDGAWHVEQARDELAVMAHCDTPLDQLAALYRAAEHLATARDLAIVSLLRKGCGPSAIGHAIGKSRQAVSRRYLPRARSAT